MAPVSEAAQRIRDHRTCRVGVDAARDGRHDLRSGMHGIRTMTRAVTQLADEQGAVLVTFAFFAPLAILLAVLAIDTNNWFVHSRHLQLQADAGVLATAKAFQGCFTNAATANSTIRTVAEQYSGIAGSPTYNTQIKGPGSPSVHELINSKTFYEQPSQVDGSAVEKPPCEAS